jgi:hypothetical protein
LAKGDNMESPKPKGAAAALVVGGVSTGEPAPEMPDVEEPEEVPLEASP